MAELSSSEIKQVRSLSQKKFRDQQGLFIVEGDKMVGEALSSGFKVEKIYRREEIGEKSMSRISSLQTPPPSLAVVRIPDTSDVTPEKNGLYLGLDAIRDPGNLGTIIRIADWFGINTIFASADTVDMYNPKVVQASMGAIFRVPVKYCCLEQTARSIIESGGRVYGTFLDGEDIYSRHLLTGEDRAVMIVVGNEANGISAKMAETVSDKLYIPPYPGGTSGSESLNAAVATAVTVAEFRRLAR